MAMADRAAHRHGVNANIMRLSISYGAGVHAKQMFDGAADLVLGNSKF